MCKGGFPPQRAGDYGGKVDKSLVTELKTNGIVSGLEKVDILRICLLGDLGKLFESASLVVIMEMVMKRI